MAADTLTRLRRNAEKQANTLRDTIAEIQHLERTAPGAAALLDQLKVKRARQAKALEATQQYIDILTKTPPATDTPPAPKRK